MSTWISQSKAAKGAGCSQQYISKLIKQGLIDTNAKKQVQPSQLAARLKSGTKPKVGAPDYWTEKARHEKYKADMAEIDLEVRQGKFVEIELVGEHLDKIFTVIKQKILAMPTKLAPSLIGMESSADVQIILESELTEILGELSNYNGETGKLDRENREPTTK